MKELHGPNGYVLRIVSRTDELLEMEATYAGDGELPAAHLHPAQTEHFEVLEGAVRAIVDGAGRVYSRSSAPSSGSSRRRHEQYRNKFRDLFPQRATGRMVRLV